MYLSFPISDSDICVFGGGFQAAVLDALWMNERDIHYFGDQDEHGLEILSLFRARYPKTKSLMMDTETYTTFREYSVKGEKVESRNAFANLTEAELALLSTLRASAPAHSRLEQERIPQDYIRKAISNIG